MSIKSDKQLDNSISLIALWGATVAMVLVFGLGGWSAMTWIESAVIAPAQVVVESSKKQVQPDTAGVVAEIKIREGDLVKSGDLLFRLDGKQLAAEIAALSKRRFDYSVRRLRLSAEREGRAELELPTELRRAAGKNPELTEIVDTQQMLLAAKLTQRQGRREQLGQRIEQLKGEIDGLKKIRAATQEELDLFDEELASLTSLRELQLVNVSRYNALRRASAQKRGVLGQTNADIARTEGKISETKLQIIDLTTSANSEILKELEGLEAELAQLSESLRSAQDRRDKLEIRASDSGHIHELVMHTIGGVVKPGDTLAFIVPSQSKLVVDANVQTIDRDQIYPGMSARVRFTAFSQRTTPELFGEIQRVASDQSGGQDGRPAYYAVRIALSHKEVERLGTLEIVPGMPAEVMMTAKPRTVLSYLMKPVTDQFNRAFRDE